MHACMYPGGKRNFTFPTLSVNLFNFSSMEIGWSYLQIRCVDARQLHHIASQLKQETVYFFQQLHKAFFLIMPECRAEVVEQTLT